MRFRHLTLFSALVLASCGPKGAQVPSIFHSLRPQSYTWYPQRAPSGPVFVFVSIPRQEAVVYRNGIRIGRASVSTGRDGHETPTGVYQILQKDVIHHSSLYNSAPMPYMQRLTWDGVALHAGFNPGHPDSHGCIRLPEAFAKNLFQITHTGGTVVVSNSSKLPTMTMVNSFNGASNLSSSAKISKSKATSIVVSTRSHAAQIYQSGAKVIQAPVDISGGLQNFKGEAVFLYSGDYKWHSVLGEASTSELHQDLHFPRSLADQLHQALHPGTTMIITSEPILSR